MNNRIRLFADLVRVDAWREKFEPNNPAKVFVELSFRRGHFGGDSSAIPFTFSASLKKATLTIDVEQPLRIDRKSVSRSIPQKEIELNQYLAVRKSLTGTAEAELGINPRRFAAGLSGSLKGEIDVSKGEERRVTETVPPILVKAQPGGSNSYSWDMEPSYQPFLENQPWNPIEEPRLSVIHQDVLRPDDRSIKVTLECQRTDIEIDDLKLKDETLQSRVENMIFRDMNEAAAIQYIKICLEKVELSPGLLSNRFSSVKLADILAGPE